MGALQNIKDRFLHEHDSVSLALLLSLFSRPFPDRFLDLCPSVCPSCVCFPGRALRWGISRCLVCIISPFFVNVALIISAFSSLDFSLQLAQWASRTTELQTSAVYVLSEITLGNFKACCNVTSGKLFLQPAILHCAVLLGVGSFFICTWLVLFYEWPCAC